MSSGVEPHYAEKTAKGIIVIGYNENYTGLRTKKIVKPYRCIVLTISLLIIYSATFLFLMHRIEGREYSVTDAVYWVITTITTVGFGDIVFTSTIGRIFSVVVSFSGVFIIFALILPLIVMPWIESIRNILPAKITERMKNHILICGYNEIIETLINKLMVRKIPFACVDNDEEVIRDLSRKGVQCVYGNPSDENVLKSLMIDKARFLVLSMDEKKEIEIILAASALFDGKIIALAEDATMARYLKYTNVDFIFAPKYMIGNRIGEKAIDLSPNGPLIIAGFGDVGRQVAKVLDAHNVRYAVVDKKRLYNVKGVLNEAGIMNASGIIITLNNDIDIIFSTLLVRKMNPELKIICRANSEKSVDKIHKAGADCVIPFSTVVEEILEKMKDAE